MASIRAKHLKRRKNLMMKLTVIMVFLTPALCTLVYMGKIDTIFYSCIPITATCWGAYIIIKQEYEEEIESYGGTG